MKKLISVMLLVMSVMVVNAQVDRTPSSSDSVKTPAGDVKVPGSGTASTLKIADLPKSITESIAKDYPGYTIKEAMKAKDEGADYKVVVSKGTTTETLLYDKNGKFVKKGTVKSESHDAGMHKDKDKNKDKEME